MNSREEILFTESLVAALRYLKVGTIPFGNKQFNKGIVKIESFIDQKKKEKDIDIDIIEDIETLFVKTYLEGDYERFKKALERHNGYILSFKNPEWKKALIEISARDAENILNNTARYKIPKELIIEAAKEFCLGANIDI